MTIEITKDLSLKELASIVSTALENAGIDAVLTGGGAVSIYSDNNYESYDLDFISSHNIDEVAAALAPLGFTKTLESATSPIRIQTSTSSSPLDLWHLENWLSHLMKPQHSPLLLASSA